MWLSAHGRDSGPHSDNPRFTGLGRNWPCSTPNDSLLSVEHGIIMRSVRTTTGTGRSVLWCKLGIMDEVPISEPSEKKVPRWIQVPAGFLLGLLTLFCGFSVVTFLFVPDKKNPILTIVVGLLLLLGCVWVLEKCFRLLT